MRLTQRNIFINKIVLFFSVIALVLLSSCSKDAIIANQNLKLWYRQPADATAKDSPDRWTDDTEWLKALPLGNGSLGAMVFGDVHKERIQLSEESMWSGSPNDDDNPNAFPALKKIRQLLFDGKYKEATELTKKTQICKGEGSGRGQGAKVPFGSFQTLGDLWIDFKDKSSYKNYHRELDLNKAVVRVSYTQNEIQYKREIFVSHPDQLMVVKLTADKPKSLSFVCNLSRPENFYTVANNNQLVMKGMLANGKGGDGLQYITRLTAKNKNGTVKYENNTIIVENADEVTLLLSASTDYVLKYPNYKGRNYKNITQNNLKRGITKPYQEILNDHIQDYQNYFNRVSFQLTKEIDTIPTDVRLEKFKESKSDLHLVELFFQFGRYLLISSSRPSTLPANLQGIWANKIQTAWNGDYHTDINVQMNYWPVEVVNLSEMHLPLFDLLASLQKPGSKTAKIHYNADGWLVHPITNVWGFTSPGENSNWGMHVGGGAWLTTHIMEHYYFTLDKQFLKEKYSILESSTKFYMDWLIEDPKTGELISGPSVSPENGFLAPDGSRSKICMGPSHDQQVIWQLFKNFIDASNELKIANIFLEEVKIAQKRLANPKIGSDGRLMEWNEEFEETEKGHRHISHLFGLHPGYQIDIVKTPKLAMAAKKSIEYRIKHGGGHTGWSAAWLVNQYARLKDAKNAEENLNAVLAKSVSPNLFGSHPPFQIDANFGATAGIAEMLIQSQSGKIDLLPALPNTWSSGEVTGLCARDGFIVDMKWKEGNLNYLRIFSKNGKKVTINYKGKIIKLNTKKGEYFFPLDKFLTNTSKMYS